MQSNRQKLIAKINQIPRIRLFKNVCGASQEELSEKVEQVITAHSKATEYVNIALKWRQKSRHAYEDLKSLLKLSRVKAIIQDEWVNEGAKTEKKERADFHLRALVRKVEVHAIDLQECEAVLEMARNALKDAEIRKQGLSQQISLYGMGESGSFPS